MTARTIVHLSAALFVALLALSAGAQQRPLPPVLLDGAATPEPPAPPPEPPPPPPPEPTPRTGSVPAYPPTSGVPYNLGARAPETQGVRWPTSPNITREVSVRTQTEFNTALRANNTRSVLAAGRTFSGGLLTCSDCEIVGYGATVNGDMRLGGRRFGLIGLDVRGACHWPPGTPAPTDGMIWNSNCTSPTNGASTFQMSAPGWRRMALVYSTFRVMNSAATGGWAFFVQNGGSGPPYVGEELIIAASRIQSRGQVSRFQDMRGLIFRDSMFYSENQSRPALRIRYATRDFDSRGNVYAGSTTGQDATTPVINGQLEDDQFWYWGRPSSVFGPNGVFGNSTNVRAINVDAYCEDVGGACDARPEPGVTPRSGGWPTRPNTADFGADH